MQNIRYERNETKYRKGNHLIISKETMCDYLLLEVFENIISCKEGSVSSENKSAIYQPYFKGDYH